MSRLLYVEWPGVLAGPEGVKRKQSRVQVVVSGVMSGPDASDADSANNLVQLSESVSTPRSNRVHAGRYRNIMP